MGPLVGAGFKSFHYHGQPSGRPFLLHPFASHPMTDDRFLR